MLWIKREGGTDEEKGEENRAALQKASQTSHLLMEGSEKKV